jgi:hypothetical protein
MEMGAPSGSTRPISRLALLPKALGSPSVPTPASSTSFEDDLVPTPGTTYTYQLVTVSGGVGQLGGGRGGGVRGFGKRWFPKLMRAINLR